MTSRSGTVTSYRTHTFADWADSWMVPARFAGPDVPDVAGRIRAIVAAWTAPVPDGWQRPHDARLHRPGVRYVRTHRHGAPRPGSEHELELQILGDDPAAVRTLCDDAALVDGINAVPLARDPQGGRRGNVEADMLLLTHGANGYRQWLVEAKTRSNNAWFGVVESLRQLRLFRLSDTARQIIHTRNPGIPAMVPVTAIVLAPPLFYTAAGAKRRSVRPAQALLDAVTDAAAIDVHLAIWDLPDRTIRLLDRRPQ